MNSKYTIRKITIVTLIVIIVMSAFLLTGCGETVDFFLNHQTAQASSSSGPTFWTDYGSNPLFGGATSGVNRAYYPAAVKVGSTYHIWYGDGNTTRHATSSFPDFNDITHPASEITIGGAGISAYFGTYVYHPSVYYNSSGWTISNTYFSQPYLMYATPGFTSVNALVSFDGNDWTNLGACTGIFTYPPQGSLAYNFNIICEDGTNWKAYADQNSSHIQYFISSNGFDWIGTAAYILSNSYSYWEIVSNQIRPCVVKAGNTYVLFYSSGWTVNDNAVGYAVSTDGMSFIKTSNNMIFSTNDGPLWKLERAYAAWVIQDGAIWRMYYTGKSTNGVYSIGMATKSGSLY